MEELAAICDDRRWTDGCAGFNNNGVLKRCVRGSCGAVVGTLSGHPRLVSCFRTDTPLNQSPPAGCSKPGPQPPGPPGPPGPDTPPYGGRCNTTAYEHSCTCSGVHPPFGEPANPVPPQRDYHFPVSERAERAGLTLTRPVLLGVDPSKTPPTAKLQFPGGAGSRSLAVGQKVLGWTLLAVSTAGFWTSATDQERLAPAVAQAVLEHPFAEWAEMVYLSAESSAAGTDTGTGTPPRAPISIRKPIGRLDQIAQPVYDVDAVDGDYSCKQDVDPTDWLGRLSANMYS